MQIPISSIQFSPNQPRRYLDQKKLEQLIESVKTHGILENLVVRPLSDGEYELVVGERRLKAAIAAGMTEVPVTVRELTNEQALSLALIENLQRTDLNPIEETEGIITLLGMRLRLTPDKIPALLYRLQHESRGKVAHNIIGTPQFEQIKAVFSEVGRFTWESFVVNRLPLLKMPPEILGLVREGKLAYTKAQAIARIEDKDFQKALLNEALSQNLSLGQLRQKINKVSGAVLPTVSRSLFSETYQRIQNSKAWNDPQKRERVKELLRELSTLLDS